MRNSLLDEYGSYRTTNFEGSRGLWRLISSEDNGSLLDTLDTFTDGKGNYITLTRGEIDKQVELGKIKGI